MIMYIVSSFLRVCVGFKLVWSFQSSVFWLKGLSIKGLLEVSQGSLIGSLRGLSEVSSSILAVSQHSQHELKILPLVYIFLLIFSFDDELPLDRQPGKHFTLVSNIGCKSDEVRLFETFGLYRQKTEILTKRNEQLLKFLTKRTKLKVRVVNVCEQINHGESHKDVI